MEKEACKRKKTSPDEMWFGVGWDYIPPSILKPGIGLVTFLDWVYYCTLLLRCLIAPIMEVQAMSQIHQAAETGSKDRQPLPYTGIINLFYFALCTLDLEMVLHPSL